VEQPENSGTALSRSSASLSTPRAAMAFLPRDQVPGPGLAELILLRAVRDRRGRYQERRPAR
jgi:hypothetical protein